MLKDIDKFKEQLLQVDYKELFVILTEIKELKEIVKEELKRRET